MALPIRKQLQQAAPKHLKNVFEVKTLTAFEDIIDPAIRKSLTELNNDEIQELTNLAAEALLNKGSKKTFLKRIGTLVGENYSSILIRSLDETTDSYGVPFIFRGGLGGFNNAILDEEFQKSLTRRQAIAIRKKRDLKEINALDWAIKNPSKAGKAELERLFGKEYKKVFRELKGRKTITKLEKNQLDKYDELVALGVTDYATLAKGNKGFGRFFEVDHLLEQRFWRNNPDVVSAFDEKGQSLAFLVPKNPHIALLLQANVPKHVPRIRYVHTVKTKSLKDLIPHGKEHLYSVQEIWDAHILTFDALGFERSEYLERLHDMFKIYVDGLNATKSIGDTFVKVPSTALNFPTADVFPVR